MESINQNLEITYQKLKQIEEKMNYQKTLIQDFESTSTHNKTKNSS